MAEFNWVYEEKEKFTKSLADIVKLAMPESVYSITYHVVFNEYEYVLIRYYRRYYDIINVNNMSYSEIMLNVSRLLVDRKCDGLIHEEMKKIVFDQINSEQEMEEIEDLEGL